MCLCDKCQACPGGCPGCAGPDGPIEIAPASNKSYVWPGVAYLPHMQACGMEKLCYDAVPAPDGKYKLSVGVRDTKTGAPRTVTVEMTLPVAGGTFDVPVSP